MHKVVTASEIPEFAEGLAEENINVLKLQVGRTDFGFLYLTPDVYTLAWPGELDFKYIDETAQYFFTRQLDDEYSRHDRRTESYSTKVTLIVSDELKRFTFDESDQPPAYRAVLEEAELITFARYDFQLKQSPAAYSFSAESSQTGSRNERELAILLPRSEQFAKGLLTWMIRKHVSFSELKLGFDYHASYKNLIKIINDHSL